MVMFILMMLILLVDVFLMLISNLVVLILKRFLVDCGVITNHRNYSSNFDVQIRHKNMMLTLLTLMLMCLQYSTFF
jgi:hypothetical protein